MRHITERLTDRKHLLRFVLPAIAMIATLSFAFAATSNLVHGPISEDGYLSLSIARHIALGHGITTNGLQDTNGFQPLFVVLVVPIFAIFQSDPITPLRFVLVIQWLVQVSSAVLVGLIVRDTFEAPKYMTFLTGFLLFFVSLFVLNKFFNGLETGLLLLVYLVLWRFYQITGLTLWSHTVSFGILLGLLILTRIDAGIFAVVFAIGYLVSQVRKGQAVRAVGQLSIIAIAAVLVSSPWWLYNYTQFGSFMPTSGKALSVGYAGKELHPIYVGSTLETRLRIAMDTLSRNLMPFVYGSRFEVVLPLETGRVVLAGLFGLLVIRYRRLVFRIYHAQPTAIEDMKSRNSLLFGLWFALAMVILVFYYVNFNVATWFYERYFSPIALLSVILLIVPCALLLSRKSKRLLYVGLAGLTMGTVGFISLYHLGRAGQEQYPLLLEVVERYVPPNEHVAAFESGYLSYYRGGILNLDGKTNSDIEQYYRKGDLLPYLVKEHIRWAVGPLAKYAPSLADAGWVEVGRVVGVGDNWIVYHQK